MRALEPRDLDEVMELSVTQLDDDPGWQNAFPEDRRAALSFLLPRLHQVRQEAGARTWVRGMAPIRATLTVLPSRARPGLVPYLKHGLVQMPWTFGVATTRSLLEMDRQRSRLRAILEPPEPHHHLQDLVAASPDHARALLRDWLATVEGTTVSTLTSRASLVALYEAEGFSLVGQDGIDKAFTAWMLVRARS